MVGRDNPPPQRGPDAELQALRAQVATLTAERSELSQRLAQRDAGEAEELASSIEAFERLVASNQLERPGTRSLRAYVEAAARQLAMLAEREQSSSQRATELEEANRALQAQLESGAEAMAETLRRIEAIQGQFDVQTAERDARVRELEAALAEAREPSPGAVDDEGTISRLIEENRRLASQIEGMSRDLLTMQLAANEAKDGLEAVREETSVQVRNELASELATVRQQRESLQKQLDLATQQLSAEGKSPVLPADRVAEMLTTLVSQMQGGMPGLSIQAGELKLRVGLEAVGSGVGFVIPSSESSPELRESLQEVILRFDNRSDLIR